MTDSIPPPQAEAPKKKRGGCLKIVGGVIGALILLIIIGVALSDPADEEPATTPASETVPLAEETTPAAEPTEATATPTPKPKSKVYSGSGDRVVKIKKPSGSADEPVIAIISHKGSSNFAVWTLDEDLEQRDLLVNTIGDYKGTVAVDFEEGATTRIQVEADGSWKMTLKSVDAARRFSSKTKGVGDDVVHYTNGAKVANITHKGSSNFAIWYYGMDGRDLLVNEIGNYKGQSPLRDEAYLVITADGPWTISAK